MLRILLPLDSIPIVELLLHPHLQLHLLLCQVLLLRSSGVLPGHLLSVELLILLDLLHQHDLLLLRQLVLTCVLLVDVVARSFSNVRCGLGMLLLLPGSLIRVGRVATGLPRLEAHSSLYLDIRSPLSRTRSGRCCLQTITCVPLFDNIIGFVNLLRLRIYPLHGILGPESSMGSSSHSGS